MRPPRMGHVSTHLSGLLDRLGQVSTRKPVVREAFPTQASATSLAKGSIRVAGRDWSPHASLRRRAPVPRCDFSLLSGRRQPPTHQPLDQKHRTKQQNSDQRTRMSERNRSSRKRAVDRHAVDRHLDA